MKFNRILIRINRISAWLLLIFMVIYIISGYAWTNRILMPLYLAKYLHTALDIYMIPLFLAHVLIGTKFTLKRHGIHHDGIVDLAPLLIGVISYILVLMIR
ncbi:MAG: hypothetical protein MUO26_08270 [Methanotrichaceae archaeon]|nr:hypothetical protein [Methanotrichaceae archaeon]